MNLPFVCFNLNNFKQTDMWPVDCVLASSYLLIQKGDELEVKVRDLSPAAPGWESLRLRLVQGSLSRDQLH